MLDQPESRSGCGW